MTTNRVVPGNDAPPRASDSSYPIALDAREHNQAWTALRDRESKLRAQAAELADQGYATTARILTRNADRCRAITDRLDEARFPKTKQEAANAG
jgi:hypothetical protein